MVLDGRFAAEALFEKLKEEIKTLNTVPTLTVVQVGDNPASNVYIKHKKKKLEELGLGFNHVKLREDIEESELIDTINILNNDNNVHGVILQLPIPEHLEPRKFLDIISPQKDVDCLTATNLGRFFVGESKILPATPLGVIRLLSFYKIDVKGKNVCVVGRSNLVGKPLAVALTNLDATVILCHSKTENLKELTQVADIVVTAAGKAKFFDSTYFNSRQTVIDVGISKDETGNLSGDVDFEDVSKIVENITPVPGGVGPMTIYSLIENLITLAK